MLYEFRAPPQWSTQRLAEEHTGFAALIEAANTHPAEAPAWLRLATRMPAGLRAALAAELRNGNRIIDISSSGWPNKGSIVVTLGERFSAARKALPAGVVWSLSNDPHSWREDLSEKADGIDFLIVT